MKKKRTRLGQRILKGLTELHDNLRNGVPIEATEVRVVDGKVIRRPTVVNVENDDELESTKES